MPLIDLKTTLKDLKFGTRAPYIVKDINNPPTYNSLSDPASRRTDDILRLTTMLTHTPGAKFTANQVLLQSFNKNNYESDAKTLLGQVADILGNIVVSTGRTATISLAQAGVEGSGLRLILPPQSSYYYTDGITGGATAVSDPVIANGRGVKTIYSSRTSKYANLEIRGTQNRVAGNINVENLNKHKYDLSENYVDMRISPVDATTEAGIAAQKGKSIKVKTEGKYHFATRGKSDRVNLLDVGGTLENDDDKLLAKVVFSRYNNGDHTGTKVFRAFIGNISDTFAARWNPVDYMGRMEQFFVYTGFSRTLTFPLTVPIFSKAEQLPVYNKVNSLISHTAPIYTGDTGIPSGVITYLEIGDYIKSPGVLTNVSVTVNNDVPWSIGDQIVVGKQLILPQVLQLQVQFMPIHTQTPQYEQRNIAELKLDGSDFRYIASGEKFGPVTPAEQEALAARIRAAQAAAAAAEAAAAEQRQREIEARGALIDSGIETIKSAEAAFGEGLKSFSDTASEFYHEAPGAIAEGINTLRGFFKK